MATEFFKSIPPEIIEKLREYVKLHNPYAFDSLNSYLETCEGFDYCFIWGNTPEGDDFWCKHYRASTFPRWSDELNRFID